MEIKIQGLAKKVTKIIKTEAQEQMVVEAIARGVRPFPVVGIGSSAGGINAVSELLDYCAYLLKSIPNLNGANATIAK